MPPYTQLMTDFDDELKRQRELKYALNPFYAASKPLSEAGIVPFGKGPGMAKPGQAALANFGSGLMQALLAGYGANQAEGEYQQLVQAIPAALDPKTREETLRKHPGIGSLIAEHDLKKNLFQAFSDGQGKKQAQWEYLRDLRDKQASGQALTAGEQANLAAADARSKSRDINIRMETQKSTDKIVDSSVATIANTDGLLDLANEIAAFPDDRGLADWATFKVRSNFARFPEGQTMIGIKKAAAELLKADQGSRPSDFDLKIYLAMLSGDISSSPKDIENHLLYMRYKMIQKEARQLKARAQLAGRGSQAEEVYSNFIKVTGYGTESLRKGNRFSVRSQDRKKVEDVVNWEAFQTYSPEEEAMIAEEMEELK
jgi:hypothetical protein